MRIFTAISWFFKILLKGNAAFAEAPAADKPTFAVSSNPAVQLLGLLQREGRLVDFLREDIGSFSDDEIGAAVRPIHHGCRKVLDEKIELRRILSEAEGSPVAVPEGFDPSQIELQGNVSGSAPYKGTLIHGGWYVESMKLPTVPEGADPNVAAPAQVEVQ